MAAFPIFAQTPWAKFMTGVRFVEHSAYREAFLGLLEIAPASRAADFQEKIDTAWTVLRKDSDAFPTKASSISSQIVFNRSSR